MYSTGGEFYQEIIFEIMILKKILLRMIITCSKKQSKNESMFLKRIHGLILRRSLLIRAKLHVKKKKRKEKQNSKFDPIH